MATESPLQILSSLGIRGGGGGAGAGAGAGAGGGGDALTNAVVGLEMPNNDNGESLAKELEMLLRERNLHEAASERELELELSLYRSGSAPPRVQGSVATVGGLFPNRGNTAGAAADGNYGSSSGISEEELRSHPAYLDYYYRHVNLNPRLPHPLVSREDWKLAQRLKANNGPAFDGGIGDLRGSAGFGESNSHRSLFSTQPGLGGLPTHKEEDHEGFHGGDKLVRQGSAEWLEGSNDGLIGLSAGGGLGSRRKSFADVIQEELGMPGTNIELFSRPSSRAAHNSDIDQLTPDVLGQLRKSSLSSYSDNETLSSATSGLIRAQSLGNQSLQSFAAAVGSSLSRNPTPEPQHIKGSGSLCGPTVGRANPEIISGFSSDSSDLAASFAALKVSPEGFSHARIQADNDRDSFKQSAKSLKSSILKENQVGSGFGETRGFTDVGMTLNSSKEQLRNLQQTPSASSIFSAQSVNAAGISNGDSSSGQYINQHVSNSVSSSISGYPVNPMLLNPMMAGYGAPGGFGPLYDNNIAASAAAIAAGGVDSRSILNNLTSGSTPDISHMYRLNGQIPGSGLQMPAMDALGLTQLQKTAEFASRAYMGNNYFDGFDIHRAYIAAFLAQQHSQYGMPYLGKSDNMNSRYLETPSYGFTMPFSVSPIGSQGLTGSPMTHVTSSIRNNERNSRYSSSSKVSGGIWNAESILDADIRHGSSLLDEFKTNKTRCFELSDITGHVSEFSADQVGSRFIQQKLETASTEEKNMIFREIFPEALHLMTDVFGNYVLQKFFEHGTPVQRRELANLLSGHVLEFSLQMYGCRVIQKAVEVVDMDQKINLVQELDGNVMRCVRDQNGNHVIQKCIECIPQDKIYFIISSFFGQVVTLSMHPYGCRVIQRVLEHCKDEKIQSMMMEEILQSVCALAQDQYGNYVVQHVLEHGKQHERAAVVKKLAGQIVQMSQQKFASNVIEKCLQFGGLAERQVLINEMLGSSDENEPLQAMMKDQFANYVVQKVFETCDDDQCELILSRIKVHLNSLKKYTYGKHIVARVEKLLAAGEKRNGTRPNFNL